MPRPVSRVFVSCELFQSSILQCTSAEVSSTIRCFLLRGTDRVLLLNLQPKTCLTGFSTRYLCTVCGGWSKILPSRSERRNLIYSECAHTNGHADPVGFPRNSSSAGISSASQTCSGNRRPFPLVQLSIMESSTSASLGRPAASS